eukprot:CAMPEP_0197939182 /NCGR_PEP_ID=MMETSP1439-20131203/119282_1 /TAXON_ID=66791 /ORGANISM="Gonyaulax spinifera, Strain CCMP409" /LENGTH=264 /DNA_ID=CAMNT_0043562291 /DNA_START=45 /DNA_END=838 /DNA_ORIENTATION=-
MEALNGMGGLVSTTTGAMGVPQSGAAPEAVDGPSASAWQALCGDQGLELLRRQAAEEDKGRQAGLVHGLHVHHHAVHGGDQCPVAQGSVPGGLSAGDVLARITDRAGRQHVVAAHQAPHVEEDVQGVVLLLDLVHCCDVPHEPVVARALWGYQVDDADRLPHLVAYGPTVLAVAGLEPLLQRARGRLAPKHDSAAWQLFVVHAAWQHAAGDAGKWQRGGPWVVHPQLGRLLEGLVQGLSLGIHWLRKLRQKAGPNRHRAAEGAR